jgi:hypothetical protein
MKTNIYIALLVSLLLASCVSLDEDPQSFITTDQFYKTSADAVSAVTSIYNSLGHNTDGDHASLYNRLLVLAVGMSSDDHIAGPRATVADVRSIAVLGSSKTNTRYSALWRRLYQGINRANAAIDRIPAINMDATLQTRLVREAKFLRALYYFDLVRLWGDVPLVLHETTSLDNLNVSRDPADKVYAQIISDLQEAEQLPASYTGTDVFRATSGAAKAILIDLYATRQQWPNVISKYAEISKAPYSYDLFPSFADVFSVSKKNTVEHIFDVQCFGDGKITTSNGTGNFNILAQIAAPVAIKGGDADAPHPSLYPIFSTKDKRRDVTFYTSYTLNGKTTTITPHFGKYVDPAATAILQSSVNIPIIRYAEIVLFNAEAINELNGPTNDAYNAVNRIRLRAGLPNLTEGLTKEQFRDSVYLERRKEFVYEQIRWFDLIREIDKDGNKTVLVSAIKKIDKGIGKTDADIAKYYLLPIPQAEIDTNPNLTQNPNW